MKNRLVCECYDIWTDDIKKALCEGASSFEDLERSMKLGVLCGACVNDSKRVIAELKNELENE